MKSTLRTSLLLISLWAFISLSCGLPQAKVLAQASNIEKNLEAGSRQEGLPAWRAALSDSRPVNFDGSLRRPFQFFRQAANRPLRPFILLSFLLLFGWVLGLSFPQLRKTALKTCGNKFISCLIQALLFSVLTMTLARLAFLNESLLPLGLFCMGLIQFAYALGLVTGLLMLAEKLGGLGKNKFKGQMAVSIFLVSLTLVAISCIPALGPIPRLGNRLLFLLALLGLGSLLEALREKLRQNN